MLLSDGNNVANVDQELTTVPLGAYAAAKVTVATANKKFGFLFPIEARDARQIIGGTASLSFKARKGGSNATLGSLRAAIISWSGTEDVITRDVVSGTSWGAAGTNPTLAANYENTPSNLALTTSYQEFKIENVAIDTASAKNVGVFIWTDDTNATVNDIVYLADINLVPGAVATSYKPAGICPAAGHVRALPAALARRRGQLQYHRTWLLGQLHQYLCCRSVFQASQGRGRRRRGERGRRFSSEGEPRRHSQPISSSRELSSSGRHARAIEHRMNAFECDHDSHHREIKRKASRRGWRNRLRHFDCDGHFPRSTRFDAMAACRHARRRPAHGPRLACDRGDEARAAAPGYALAPSVSGQFQHTFCTLILKGEKNGKSRLAH